MEMARWKKPDGSTIIANSNGAFDPLTRESTIGIITRDSQGSLIGVCFRKVHVSKLEEAKVVALGNEV